MQAYGVDIEPPPASRIEFTGAGTWQVSEHKVTYGTVEWNVPDGYVVESATFTGSVRAHGANKNEPANFAVIGDQSTNEMEHDDKGGIEKTFQLTDKSVVGRTGKVSLLYAYFNTSGEGGHIVKIRAKPTDEAMENWRVKAWNQLREADQAAYEAGLQRLQDRKAQLEKDIANFDGLTLRRMEREEIMRLVLQWLFGPSFQFVPTLFEILGLLQSLIPSPDPLPQGKLDPALLSPPEWKTVRKYGEFIKYIHNAVEWENVLFFSYPYFWDLVENWPFKRFLVHPDFDHRTFLRAGCARVVLTIRPGFECSFARLVEHFTAPSPNPPGDQEDECAKLGQDPNDPTKKASLRFYR